MFMFEKRGDVSPISHVNLLYRIDISGACTSRMPKW